MATRLKNPPLPNTRGGATTPPLINNMVARPQQPPSVNGNPASQLPPGFVPPRMSGNNMMTQPALPVPPPGPNAGGFGLAPVTEEFNDGALRPDPGNSDLNGFGLAPPFGGGTDGALPRNFTVGDGPATNGPLGRPQAPAPAFVPRTGGTNFMTQEGDTNQTDTRNDGTSGGEAQNATEAANQGPALPNVQLGANLWGVNTLFGRRGLHRVYGPPVVGAPAGATVPVDQTTTTPENTTPPNPNAAQPVPTNAAPVGAVPNLGPNLNGGPPRPVATSNAPPAPVTARDAILGAHLGASMPIPTIGPQAQPTSPVVGPEQRILEGPALPVDQSGVGPQQVDPTAKPLPQTAVVPPTVDSVQVPRAISPNPPQAPGPHLADASAPVGTEAKGWAQIQDPMTNLNDGFIDLSSAESARSGVRAFRSSVQDWINSQNFSPQLEAAMKDKMNSTFELHRQQWEAQFQQPWDAVGNRSSNSAPIAGPNVIEVGGPSIGLIAPR